MVYMTIVNDNIKTIIVYDDPLMLIYTPDKGIINEGMNLLYDLNSIIGTLEELLGAFKNYKGIQNLKLNDLDLLDDVLEELSGFEYEHISPYLGSAIFIAYVSKFVGWKWRIDVYDDYIRFVRDMKDYLTKGYTVIFLRHPVKFEGKNDIVAFDRYMHR